MGDPVILSSFGVSMANATGCGANRDGHVVCWTHSPTTPFASAVGGVTDARQVSYRYTHGCAARQDGHAVCWGSNSRGELGNGGLTASAVAVAVTGLSGVAAVAVGLNHSCALRSDGAVFCWGDNRVGQLGDGTITLRTTAVRVAGLVDAVALWAGDQTTCARRTDGTVVCWGDNASGQLGDGTTTNHGTPTPAPGWNNSPRMSLGRRSTCALLAGGTVRCAGDNGFAQLGDGTRIARSTPVSAGTLSGQVSLGLGDGFACSLAADFTVRCWGRDEIGQAGIRHEQQNLPRRVLGLSSITSLASTRAVMCALDAAGVVRCWAAYDGGGNGEFGNGTSGANTNGGVGGELQGIVTVRLPEAASSVRGGFYHLCAQQRSGGLYCWGYNAHGELGARRTESIVNTPVAVLGLTGAVADYSLGGLHTCALVGTVASRSVQCWGYNFYGAVGNNSYLDRNEATTVGGLATASSLSLGIYHSCALMASGEVTCWGDNRSNAVGDGTTTNSLVPVFVQDARASLTVRSNLTGVRRLWCEAAAACVAQLTDNSLVAWGLVGLASGERAGYANPRGTVTGTIEDVATASDVRTGTIPYNCMVVAGVVSCGLDNTYGALGNGSYAESVPLTYLTSIVPAAGPTTLRAVATRTYTQVVPLGAGSNVCALGTDGTVDCWGAVGTGFLNVTGLDHLVRTPSAPVLASFYP
jgi:alpha-tubulin suppressor-like RCC1 family protein